MIEERYFSPNKLYNKIVNLNKSVDVSVIGKSVLKKPIYQLKLGSGPKKILFWSQMHGNESTTTRALFDFINWLLLKNNKKYLKNLSFYIIPQLNPDGAELYTRKNFNNIDLNRDAINLSQPESRCIVNLYNEINPHFCFNLHGQKTIYSVGSSKKSAVISFLAPSISHDNKINEARRRSILLIISLFKELSIDISGHISRYKDDFNKNCMGDYFTINNTPTILIEAGHFPNNYKRDITKKYVLKALIYSTLCLNDENYLKNSINDYFKIEENNEKFVDIIISGATIQNNSNIHKDQMLALNYIESFKNGKIYFTPYYVSFGKKLNYFGHKYINLKKVKNNSFNFKLGFPLKKNEITDLLSIK